MAPRNNSIIPSQSVDLPSSRELAALFQEDFVGATGFPARWAAERVQGNRRLPCSWNVPFAVSNSSRGSFGLYWDAELQRYLAGRLGPSASRPEYLGSILRSCAGRWASAQALKAGCSVRLEPSSADQNSHPLAPWNSSAALIVDSFVLELVFALGRAEA
ncbi:MAG TPA: hypothetical protein VK842_09875 [bacterium]|jgi:hypothetical protein|nr:hypothetical protein [bacterium]